MPASKLETTVRDHFHKLDDRESWGVPVLPAIVAYLRLFLSDEEDLLLLSRVDRGERRAVSLGFTSKFVFVLRLHAPVVDEDAEVHVEGSVLPRTALRSIRFISGSDTIRTGYDVAEARPLAEVVIEGIEPAIRVGNQGDVQFLSRSGDSATDGWGDLFAQLGSR